MRATILTAALAFVLVGCDEPSPESPAKKEARPPLELRLSLDGEKSKPETGEMVGRWELINHSAETKEYEHGPVEGLYFHILLEAVDTNGKSLNQKMRYTGRSTGGGERIVTRLAPGGSITGTDELSLHLYSAHQDREGNNDLPLGVYQVRLVFRDQGGEVRSNWVLVNQQRAHPISTFMYIGQRKPDAAAGAAPAQGR